MKRILSIAGAMAIGAMAVTAQQPDAKPGAEHKRIVTGGGPSSVKLAQFKAINTVLSNLKSALCGTYHAFNFAKYAHRYLAEVQYRFNRRFNLATILKRLLRAASLTPPRPAPFIRAAEECR